MNNKNIPRPAMVFLIAGLLLATSSPFVCRRFGAPDFVQGLFAGAGVALEIIALIKIQRWKNNKQGKKC